MTYFWPILAYKNINLKLPIGQNFLTHFGFSNYHSRRHRVKRLRVNAIKSRAQECLISTTRPKPTRRKSHRKAEHNGSRAQLQQDTLRAATKALAPGWTSGTVAANKSPGRHYLRD